jgi:diguanylate cyclase (GGDEF)-like protein
MPDNVVEPSGEPLGLDQEESKDEPRAAQRRSPTYVEIPALEQPIPQKLSDVFTECPSREYLINLLGKFFAAAQFERMEMCLALVELLPVADPEGEGSDAVIQAVARIFRSHLRPNDVIVRYRGTTLGLVLPESNATGGLSVCNRLRRAVSKRLFFGKEEVTVVPVFGVADAFTAGDDSAAAILAKAEEALEADRELSMTLLQGS